ncbi:hypothetical protein MSPP1_001374 [Malassezia sp. CBS 17886]|nr:hypothetical protein MSPP1_001374 [Malassezia sp. CBS 17886]
MSGSADASGGTSTKSTRPRFRKPRVKLNFSRAVAGSSTGSDGPKTRPYMQGYDRELDSEDEETGEGMAFEEQLILRIPDGPGVNGELDELRKTIKKRGALSDLMLKFKDSRRAVFMIGTQLYSAKLVDLPCIVESHKTLDNKQIFKIADISQMLLVERPVGSEGEAVEGSKERSAARAGLAKGALNDDYIYPHGVTPPMCWARKRRFRKRIHNGTIDTVEKSIEGLLNDDRRAERVEYEFIDPAEADEIELEIVNQAQRQHGAGAFDEDTELHDEKSSRDGDDDDDMDSTDGRVSREPGDDDDDEDDDENVDRDLAAELDAALAREQGGEVSASDNDQDGSDQQSRHDSDLEDLWDDDDNDADDVEVDVEAGVDGDGPVDRDDGDADKDDDDGEEEAEVRVRESQLEAECREIEVLMRRKQHDMDSTMNALIKSRHQQALQKLQTEYDLKKKHLQDIKQVRRSMREERVAEAEARAEQAARAEHATRDGAERDSAPATSKASATHKSASKPRAGEPPGANVV